MVIVVNFLQNCYWRLIKTSHFPELYTMAFHFIFSKFTFYERFLLINAVLFDFEFLNFTYFVVDLLSL